MPAQPAPYGRPIQVFCMLEKIIDWSISNKFMVVLVTIFVVTGGVYALKNTPLDAIPDLSDVQVIVYTEYPGQAPQVVEDQVTYPLTTQMLAVPGSQGGARLFLFRLFLCLHHL